MKDGNGEKQSHTNVFSFLDRLIDCCVRHLSPVPSYSIFHAPKTLRRPPGNAVRRSTNVTSPTNFNEESQRGKSTRNGILRHQPRTLKRRPTRRFPLDRTVDTSLTHLITSFLLTRGTVIYRGRATDFLQSRRTMEGMISRQLRGLESTDILEPTSKISTHKWRQGLSTQLLILPRSTALSLPRPINPGRRVYYGTSHVVPTAALGSHKEPGIGRLPMVKLV